MLAYVVAGVWATRLLEPDLTDPLGHRHEHRIDHRESADDEGQQRGCGGDRREDGASGLEAVDDNARPYGFDSGDLGVDAVGERVELPYRRASRSVDVDGLSDLRGVDLTPDGDRQAVLQQHLPVSDVAVGERIRRRPGHVEDA